MKAAYPLQLSVRVDESRKVLIFDCFEFKPNAADIDDPDLTKYYPTRRGFERSQQAFLSHKIDVNDDDYEDDDDQSYYTDMEFNEGHTPERKTERMLLFFGVAGNFAYSRILRFRFPFTNIVGTSLQKSGSSNAKGGPEDIGACLVHSLFERLSQDGTGRMSFVSRKIGHRNLLHQKQPVSICMGDWKN